ncbi:hypothetical protein M409DRAFT_63445 [Zasmidium cellare ATCC 36951]|uniref:PABS domain-containing protein n=1 Tax=Zasmidium cellare ATCC 36951 TaxID=1080233 RepID=A0A6A6CXL0_ZASCE|nr:uncharacterized protein M409DRAFT_63445 [Zasmidium cellare ATCC 36951]KAF2171904.1 hypothetical protein M409DRAFT_63445 [Zasmidium cellare ATCC 36951]
MLLPLQKSFVLLDLAAAASPIWRLSLTPAFGAIPTTSNSHDNFMIALTFAMGIFLSKGNEMFSDLISLLPLAVAWMPAIQSKLLPWTAATWGPETGPRTSSLFTVHMIVAFTAIAIPDALAWGGLKPYMEKWALPKMFLLAVLTFMYLSVEGLVSNGCTTLLTTFDFLTPVHLWFLLAFVYCIAFPSRLVLLAIPAVLHAQFSNPHFSHAAVDASLRPHNWTLLERQWSTTGYISVLDSFDMQYRVMRCDHSLLGGEWLLTEDRKQREGWQVREPIYAVFQMLEAVRLIELEPVIPDSEAQALVIGLGIGTAPKALVAHGIQTTVVELDPVVHDFATKYFDLPANHTAVIQDAVSWVQDEVTANDSMKKYDYIIHDVFTGGTEPLALFNAHFLSNLHALLTPNGVIAINYAGDLSLPLTNTILNTISHVFASQCKLYRDSPREKDALPNEVDQDSDFLNLVIFCRNAPGPITFRNPRRADYLGSKSRQYYMLPKPEHEIPFPSQQQQQQTGARSSDASYSAPQQQQEGQPRILALGDEGRFAKEQGRSAVRHWRIMRKVVPDGVWDNW